MPVVRQAGLHACMPDDMCACLPDYWHACMYKLLQINAIGKIVFFTSTNTDYFKSKCPAGSEIPCG